MKKKIIGILLCFVIIISFSGCANSNEKHMKKYMNSIELEYEGYYISNKQEDGSLRIAGMQLPATVSLRGVTLYISDSKNEEQGFDGYTIQIDEQTIEITVDYFKSQSNAFNKILKMWDENTDSEQNSQKINIGPLFVFDNELFVCSSYKPPEWMFDWKGKIPLMLYRFNENDYSLQYAGYFDRPLSTGYICKNK